jgi:hypothetical protein
MTPMRASTLRAFLLSAAVVACSSHSGASAGTPPKSTAPATVVAASAAGPVEPVSSAPAIAPVLLDASAGIAANALDGGAPDPAAPAATPAPKIVLHLGDSMVGGYGGVTKALEAKFKGVGAQFVRDWQTSVSIQTFDHEKKLQELLAKHHPDLVILTLGANDVFVPFPASLAANVKSVAAKASAGRTCYWMTPPVWKKETGIVDVIKKNAAPCKVFDSSNMKIARGGDGIHPTDTGGATWADGFWAYYQGTGPATPGAPTP